MKKSILTIAASMVFMLFGASSFAEDAEIKESVLEPKAEESSSEVYTYPLMKPEVSLWGGYRFAGVSGSSRADEFEYLHDSISLGGEIRVFDFPSRLHIDTEIKNKYDYFGDISYSYKDVVLIRDISRALYHNLDNITLIDLNPSTSSPGVDVRDKGKSYGVDLEMHNVFMRVKTPDYPFHVYLDGSLMEKTGTIQQRSLLGSGSFTNVVRTSQSRNIDWETKNFMVGANTHLGPLEVDLSHGEKRFSSGGDSVMYDSYTDAKSGSKVIRSAGTYEHNLVPELQGSSNTLKLHTSYTGGLTASATLSKLDRENFDSGAKASYLIGSADLVYMPITPITFFVKYRHKDADIDNPGSVTVTDSTNSSHSYTYDVRQSISSVTDTVTGIMRYRMMKGVTLRAEVSHDSISRDDAESWGLPDTTRKDTESLAADIRLIKNTTLKLKYTHKDISDPAYNVDPDHANEGSASITWVPTPRISTLLTYSLAGEKRDDIVIADAEEAKNRNVHRQKLLGSISYVILPNLSFTASYSYMRNKTVQDLVYGSTTGVEQVDKDVPYKDTSTNYSLNMRYMPIEPISLTAGVSRTVTSGVFNPSNTDLLEPVSIAEFSELKTRETAYSLSGEYRFKNGLTTALQYKVTTFNDLLDNAYDDIEDGTAHVILLTLAKKW